MITQSRRGRPSAISTLSTTDLMRELERRQSLVAALESKRSTIAHELESLEAEIASLGGTFSTNRRGPGRPKGSRNRAGLNGRRGRGRGGNEKSLVAMLHSMLQGKTMGVTEMADAAKRAGHKSKSKNFRTIVSLALLNRKMFKRVSRGQYTAR